MTSILLNDQYVSLIDGTVDSDLIVLNSFVSVNTGLNINEIINEPANQVKIETIIKDTIEQYGMTTNKVVILFPDYYLQHKPIFTDPDLNKDEMIRILPLELKAAFGSFYDEKDHSHYLADNFASQENYQINQAMSVPVDLLKIAEKLISFLEPEEVNVSTESTGIVNFIKSNSHRPENFVYIHLLTQQLAEIFVVYKGEIHSFFKIQLAADTENFEQMVQNLRFISEMLTYQFPDDLFQGSINSAMPDFNGKLNEILPELHIEHYELTHILSNIQTLEETSLLKLLPYLSLLGTLI